MVGVEPAEASVVPSCGPAPKRFALQQLSDMLLLFVQALPRQRLGSSQVCNFGNAGKCSVRHSPKSAAASPGGASEPCTCCTTHIGWH